MITKRPWKIKDALPFLILSLLAFLLCVLGLAKNFPPTGWASILLVGPYSISLITIAWLHRLPWKTAVVVNGWVLTFITAVYLPTPFVEMLPYRSALINLPHTGHSLNLVALYHIVLIATIAVLTIRSVRKDASLHPAPFEIGN